MGRLLPHWMELTCVMTEWLLRLGPKRCCHLHLALLDHLLGKSQLLFHEDSPAALWIGPYGEDLGPPANSHVSVPSWKQTP